MSCRRQLEKTLDACGFLIGEKMCRGLAEVRQADVSVSRLEPV